MTTRRRLGATAVEFAIIAPIFLTVVLGIVEFGRVIMVQQVMTNATREGAREAVLPDSTSTTVKTKVVNFLTESSVDVTANDITVSPDPATAYSNEVITVKVSVPYSQVGWITGSFVASNTRIEAVTKMRSERF